MATVNFLYRSKRENAFLTLRLLHRENNKDFIFSSKIKYEVEKSYWKIHHTNTRDADIKKKQQDVNSELSEISNYILKKFNNVSFNLVSTEWLKTEIYNFYNPIKENKQSELLTDAIQSIINEAPTRKNAKGGIGLSKSRVNGLKSLKNIIKEFQDRKQFKVKDVNVNFGKRFLKFLLDTKKYQTSTALKKLADLKTVCNDAELNGIETNIQYKKINSAKPNNENIIYLNTKELQQIEDTNLTSQGLQNARKWLLLGCNIGQRGGDLLSLTEKNFVTRNGLEVIELKQQKTGKNVTIPVLPKTKEVLKMGLPYKISMQKFNKYIKEICKASNINEMTKGSLTVVTEKGKGNTEKRKINGIYPKYQLMASHVCRRSFASNLYGTLTTQLIMQITAHSSEKMLLNYIGKDSLDFAQQIADFYTLQAIKENKTPEQLTNKLKAI